MSFKEFVRKREELIRAAIDHCLSMDLEWDLEKIERAWLALTVAEWTKDTKYAEYALTTLTATRYVRDDVRAAISGLAKEIGKQDYSEMSVKARREYYNLLARCLAENLPF